MSPGSPRHRPLPRSLPQHHTCLQQIGQVLPGVLKKSHIVTHILRRRIDLMRHAGGKLANGLQLLRLTKLLLEFFPFGDVSASDDKGGSGILMQRWQTAHIQP